MKILLLLFIPFISDAEDCVKSIRVHQQTHQFFVAFPFPRIITTDKDTSININCSLYDKIQIGEYLETDQIKQFNMDLNDGIPHGVLTKHNFKVLSK